MLYAYENMVCDIDVELLKQDEYCFAVLARILGGECRLTITDKKRIIICHSQDPYPVWIWLPDDATEEEKSLAYQTIKNRFGKNEKYQFNCKYSFAEYMIQQDPDVSIIKNMAAYDCPVAISPTFKPNGKLVTATEADIELAVSLKAQFHEELNLDILDTESYRKCCANFIEAKRMFFWEDEQGEKTTICSYHVAEGKGCVGNVFTRLDKRRMGYAAQCVYEVSKKIIAEGLTPCLYTDADYIASNECYKQIGYRLKGKLCTVAFK